MVMGMGMGMGMDMVDREVDMAMLRHPLMPMDIPRWVVDTLWPLEHP